MSEASSPRTARKNGPPSDLTQSEKAQLDTLILEAQRGDEDALTTLLLRYRPLVDATLVRLLGPRSENADLRQETYARAIAHLRTLKEPRGFANWLKRIATHVAVDHLRKRKQQSWLTVVDPHALPEVPVETLDELKAHRVRRIYALLDSLPTDERAAFSLRWLSEYELTEVAEICGCSLATAKRRISRGHSRFSILAQQDPLLNDSIHEPEEASS